MHIHHICTCLIILSQLSFPVFGEETDLNLLLAYEDVENDKTELVEEYHENVVVFDTLSKQSLDELCKDATTLVYIQQEDVVLSCKDIKAGSPIRVIKRSIDEVEGSGDEGVDQTTTVDENQTAAVQENQPSEVETSANPSEPNNNSTPAVEENQPAVDTTPAVEENQPAVDTTPAAEENKPSEDETSEAVEKTQTTEIAVVDETKAVEQNEPSVVETTAAEEGSTPVGENDSNLSETSPNSIEKNNEDDNINGQETPNETASPETNTEKKEINTNQESNDKHDSKKDAEIIVEGKTLLGSKKNEETHNETVKSSGSTEANKGGSKDTTILLVLLAAVVVVGVLAFGYNYIRKRKQQSHDLEAVERGSTNSRTPNKSETLPESKPLMNDKKEVEMVELKNGDSVPKTDSNNVL